MKMNSTQELLDEISLIPGSKKILSNSIQIVCPFHADKNPSLGIYISTDGKLPVGSFHCFGCGTKGQWNKLADKLGLKHFDVTKVVRTHSSIQVKKLLPDKIVEPFGIKYNNDWRGISQKTLSLVDAMLSFDEQSQMSVIWFPIRINGELLGSVKAQIIKRKVSYISQGNVLEYGLFPYDVCRELIKKYRTLFIVEGARDALRLIDNGIPAIAILGTSMISTTKIRLLSKLDAKFVVMMDGDKTKNGKNGAIEAQASIVKQLKSLGCDVTQVKLWVHMVKMGLNELDPCTLPMSFIKELKKI
jgi:5S rRNA maturation endonuclease (ribonuclease M5)